MDNLYSDFAYDDAFRTMVVKCDELLIPFINYMFDMNYSKSAQIIRNVNERYLDQQGGAQDKRITDSLLKIRENDVVHTYHVECESKDDTDGTIIVRLFEYDAQIALDRGEVSLGRLDVYFPHTGILFLSSTDSTPDRMEIVMHTSGGDNSYYVNVVKESDFDLEKVYENGLYFLLPFYSFNYKNEFDAIEADEGRQDEFVEIYRGIIDTLEELVSEGLLSSFSKDVIISLINKVSYKQLMKQKQTQKKVGDLMGGKVLDLVIIRAHDAGIEEGFSKGISKGKESGQNDLVKAVELLREGVDKEDILKQGIDIKTIELAEGIR